MAETTAGAIKLDLMANSADFQKQINDIAQSASKVLADSLKTPVKADQMFDASSLNKVAAEMRDVMRGAMDSVADTAKASITQALDAVKIKPIKVEADRAFLTAQMENLVRQLDIVNSRIYTQDRAVTELTNKYRQLQQMKLGDSPEGIKAADEISRAEMAMAKMIGTSDELSAKIRAVEAAIAQIDAQEASKLAAETAVVAKEVTNVGKAAAASRPPVEALKTTLQNTGKVGHQAAWSLSGALRGAANSSNYFAATVGRSLLTIQRMMRRMVMFKILSSIRGALAGVGQSFIQVGNMSALFGAQIDSVAASTNRLKGAFASMFMPIATYVIPVINALSNALSEAFTRVAMFFGALSGKKSVMIATGSTKRYTTATTGASDATDANTAAQKKNAKATKKAAQERARSLAGFDTLEILAANKALDDGSDALDPSGGGKAPKIKPSVMESGGGHPIFEEVAIDSGISNFVDRLKGFAAAAREIFLSIGRTPAFQFIAQSARDGFAVVKQAAADAWARVSASAAENVPRAASAWARLAEKVSTTFAFLAGDIAIPFAAGGAAASLQFGAALTDGLLTLGADLAELTESVLSPFHESVQEFFVSNGGKIRAKVYETWQMLGTGLSGIVDGIVFMFHETFGGLTEWFKTNGAEVKNFFLEIWSTLWMYIEPLWNTINEVGRTVFGELKKFFMEMSEPVRRTVVAAWDAIWNLLQLVWGKIKNVAEFVFGHLQAFWQRWGGNISRAFSTTWNYIKNMFKNVLGIIEGIFTVFSGLFSGDWEKMWEGVKMIGQNIWNSIVDTFESAKDMLFNVLDALGIDVDAIWEGIKGTFDGVITFIRNVFTGNWRNAWNGVKAAMKGVVDTFVNIVKAPINTIIDLINGFIRGINRVQVPSWVPGVGGRGINIPQIPKLARGGVIDQPMIAQVGEAGREAVMPLERNTGWINELAGKIAEVNGGGGPISLTIPIYLDASGTDLITVIKREIEREARLSNSPAFGGAW